VAVAEVGVGKETFGALPAAPETLTASEADPVVAQASGAVVALVEVEGVAAALELEVPVLDPLHPERTSTAAASATAGTERSDLGVGTERSWST
jgi:hypothetical protein